MPTTDRTRLLASMLVLTLISLLAWPTHSAHAARPYVPTFLEPEPEEPKPDEPKPEEEDADGEETDDDASESKDKDAAADDEADDEQETDEDDADQDTYIAIVGAEVHPVAGSTLVDAVVLIKNDVIHAVGRDVEVPEEAEVIDASGHQVYPGLVAIRSSSIIGDAPAGDSTNVFSLSMNLALAGGVTTVGSGNAAGKLTFGTLDGIDLASNTFFELRYQTSNPKSRREVRAAFERARQYQRDLERYQRELKDDPEAEKPDDAPTKGRGGEYLKLLRGQRTAIAAANEAQDILELAQLATDYGFDLVIRGGREAWTVAPQVARSGAAVIATPRMRTPPDPQLNRPTGSSIENAAILHQHGVRLAIVPGQTGITLWGLGGQDLQHLPLEAAFAVRGGLPENAAIRAITLDAAAIMGVDHRVGSIEPGKDADLIITDGDLLHYLTIVCVTC
ncbi:MAG: amidohydrolase family protein, partial [Planctomycetota bacterium]